MKNASSKRTDLVLNVVSIKTRKTLTTDELLLELAKENFRNELKRKATTPAAPIPVVPPAKKPSLLDRIWNYIRQLL